jgi:hypothetical protein
VWSEHAAIARKAGFTSDQLRRIAQGPDAKGWDALEATLLRLADQMFRNSSVNDATWKALAASYDMYHLMDAVMTVTDFTTISLMYNSLGVQPDEGLVDRIPTDIPYRVVVPDREPPLEVARVEPAAGTGIAIGRTFARYRKLAAPRSTDSNYVNQKSKLDPRYRRDAHSPHGMELPGRVRMGAARRLGRAEYLLPSSAGAFSIAPVTGRISVMGQFESGSGIAIASALSVGVGLRGTEISESRSPLSGPLPGLLSGPCPTDICGLTKIGPCVGHSYVRTSL